MKTVDIIERIEGEARLRLSWKNKKVSNAKIDFLNFRGYEYILKNKPILDALVYTPRICGICGQAHLLATVKALENIYKNENIELAITNKAKILRELGLNIEIIDSHIKWFHMFIMPDIAKLSKKEYLNYEVFKGKSWLRAQKEASEVIKALAVFAGQWPHTSYMVPGGVMSDPTLLDIITMENYLDLCVKYFQDCISGVSFDTYLSFNSVSSLSFLKKELKDFIDISFENSLETFGKSYDNHLVLSSSLNNKAGLLKDKKLQDINMSLIKESDDFTFDVNKDKQLLKKHTWAKAVKYDESFFEVGPLSRALVSRREFITDIHKQYNDSIFTRVMARVDELAHLLNYSKDLISKINISEESFIEPKISLKNIDYAKASSCVEACRGSLVHEIEIKHGLIYSYDIITPTVWNLGQGTLRDQGIAQKAIIGSNSLEEATLILRSFDVCSVCTTH